MWNVSLKLKDDVNDMNSQLRKKKEFQQNAYSQ